MKKLTWLVIIITIFIFGCGKVSRETIDISTPETEISETVVQTVSEKEFIASIKDILTTYSSQHLDTTQGETVSYQPKSFSMLKSFSVSNIISDAYNYWNYKIATVNNGLLIEVSEAQYRYWDKRTGQPFQKYENQFNQNDVANIDYIERYLNIFASYYDQPYDPAKAIYKMFLHEKITPQGGNYSIDLFADNYSKMEYIGWTAADLYISSRTIDYHPQTKSGTGYLKIVSASPYQAYNFESNFDIINNKFSGIADIYKDNSILASLTIIGSSQRAEILYHVGKNYVYSSLSALEGGIEDNAKIVINDNETYSETTTIEGAQNRSASTSGRLQNLSITSKDSLSSYPKFKKQITIKNTDNLTIEKLDYSKKGLKIINCSNVTIDGNFYAYINNQTFY
jgi:hypothetical protein